MGKSCLRFLGLAVLVAIIVGAISLGLGRYLGWTSLSQFSQGFFWAGLGLIVIGLLSVAGGYGMHSDARLRVSETSGDMTMSERTQRWMTDLAQDWQTLIFLALSGGLLVGASILIDSLAGAAP